MYPCHFGELHWKVSGPKALTFAGSVITPHLPKTHHPFLNPQKTVGADLPPALSLLAVGGEPALDGLRTGSPGS